MSLGYSYDAAGNLINVNESGKNFSYFYDAAGRLKKETNGVTGITTEYAYYASGNIKSLRNFGGGNLLDNYEYSYDSRGNRIEEIENGSNTTYYYDALARISSCITEEGGSLNYNYDDLGNIRQVVATGQNLYGSTPIIETNYSYDQNNRLLLQETVNGNSLEQVRFRYDNEGNQTEKAEVSKQNGSLLASSTLTFSYNGFNQLANVTDSDNNLTVYAYNAQGLRTSKHNANDGTSTKFYYDGSANIILETTAENAVTAKNIRGIHLISRENTGAEPFYYLFNAHGDVTKLTDELGNVIKDYNYDPFGNEKSSELNPLGGNLSISLWQTEAAAIDNPFRYCGEYLDSETNNYYLRARYYDAEIGRFLSEDTYTGQVTDPLSLNFYIYCKNNPIRYIDPTGHATYQIGGLDLAPTFEFDPGFTYDPDAIATDADKKSWNTWGRKAWAAGLVPWLKDAAKMYKHYRDNSGTSVEIDLERAYKEDTGYKERFDNEISIMQNFVNFSYSGGAGTSFEIIGDLQGISNGSSENWQKTIGAFYTYGYGKVTIDPSTGTATMVIKFYMEDMYNFNPGMVDIASGTPDAVNGRFAQLGWAKEFKTYGSMTKTVTWNINDSSSVWTEVKLGGRG